MNKIARSVAAIMLLYLISMPIIATNITPICEETKQDTIIFYESGYIRAPYEELQVAEYEPEDIDISSVGETGLLTCECFEPEVEEVILPYVEYAVPQYSGFKSYMPYTAITDPTSQQYIMQSQYAYTGDYGIRQVDGRFCIAVGSYYTTKMWTLIDLVLENGTIIPCIVGDQKADIHTDSNNIFTIANGCMSEFIVDLNALNEYPRIRGDVSYTNPSWQSPVAYVRVYK